MEMEAPMRILMATVLGVALVGVACNRHSENTQEKEVRAALETHLQQKGNLAMNNMTMEIQSVKFNGDTADAQVRFQSKEKPELAVGIHYVLRRVDGKWQVESSNPISGMGGDSHQQAEMPNPHGAAPAGHPSAPQPEASH
jgi:hypothetical protein